jgi:6-phosphofructokinase
MPSTFDSQLAHAFGITAAGLIARGLTGMVPTIGNIYGPASQWKLSAVPLAQLGVASEASSSSSVGRLAIQAGKVDINGKVFQRLLEVRSTLSCMLEQTLNMSWGLCGRAVSGG